MRHRLLLLTSKCTRKAGIRSRRAQNPPVGGPPSVIAGRKVHVGKRRQPEIRRAMPAPINQSKILMLVNVTHHAAQAFSVCRSPPVNVGSR
eukprot:15473571-Alexandrium_andersonii.AAC.1